MIMGVLCNAWLGRIDFNLTKNMKTVTQEDISRMMRGQAWERAKGATLSAG